MGKRIKAVRRALDLSQSDVAQVLGVTPITVSRWETGTQAPDDLTKRMIASVLKTTVAYLFGETSQSSSYESGLLPNVTEKAVELNVGKKTPNPIHPDPDDSSDALPTPATGSVVYTYKETIRVPIYEDAYAACAGNGNHNEGAEPAVMEYRIFDISEVGPLSADPDKQPFGIKVDGESMEEANIPDGSIAVCNPAATIGNGTPVLVKMGDTCAIKWVEERGTTLIFYSASSAYPPRTFTKEEQEMFDVNIIGPIVDVRLKPKWMR